MTTNNNSNKRVLLNVKNLVKHYPVRGGVFRRVKAWVKAVDDVSFHIYEGETFGLVGESGCGKTTVGRTILRLQPATSGEVIFDDQNVFDLTSSNLKKLRQEMQIIFQDPFSSLNPRMPIGESISEGLRIHTDKSAQARHDIVVEMLTRVGLRADHTARYPHEFSGGQRQRIGIARALALRPKFIVCDEPVSALDVSIQAQVLNILRELQDDFGLTYLFIAHNLSVVEHFSNRVGVMYLGKIVEMAARDDLYADPLHPYTQALMSAIPVPDPTLSRQRIILEGDVPSPLNPPSGCRFHTRCPLAFDKCAQEEPPFKDYGEDHFAACWLLETGERGASKLAEFVTTSEVQVAEDAPDSSDDLKRIEGVGPKIEEILYRAGIKTFSQLAETDVAYLLEILAEAGPRYKLAKPDSWPEQARLAAAGDWEVLTKLQEELDGGVRR